MTNTYYRCVVTVVEGDIVLVSEHIDRIYHMVNGMQNIYIINKVTDVEEVKNVYR